jgi:peroxiredoxin
VGKRAERSTTRYAWSGTNLDQTTIAVSTGCVNLSPHLNVHEMMMKRLIPRRRLLSFICLTIVVTGLHAAANAPANAKGPAVGDPAPDFNLPLPGGKDYLSLKDANSKGPVVVIVLRGYPGGQCPICKQQVAGLINRAPVLAKLAKKVILIYPGKAQDLDKRLSQFMGSKVLPEPFAIVSDPDMKVITEYGLRWKSPLETAYPATFVIDKNGHVKWSKVSDSHAGRASVQEIVEQLGKLD